MKSAPEMPTSISTTPLKDTYKDLALRMQNMSQEDAAVFKTGLDLGFAAACSHLAVIGYHSDSHAELDANVRKFLLSAAIEMMQQDIAENG